MPRNFGSTPENAVIQGLITEATGLNFPEKAVQESWNVRYYPKGNIKRRLGYYYEDDETELDIDGSAGVCRSFLWKAVGTDGSLTLLVIQVGEILIYFEPDEDGNFSGGLKSFSTDLTDYTTSIAGVSIAYAEASMASGNGKLFVCHPYCEPIYIEYDAESDTITETQYEIQVRDIEGVEDELEVQERPTTLTNLHKYNLWNQGWWERGVKTELGPNVFPLTWWAAVRPDYPSNADVWWLYKIVNEEGKETLKEVAIDIIDLGNSPAPKGHYIYNAFFMDRTSETGISGLPTKTSEGYRPSCVSFYAGRVWYSGVPHPDYQGKVYYTQILERNSQIGQCFQQNDPTAEHLSDLLATDGGEAKITGMGKVTGMVEVGNNLSFFANNGIWAVSGSGAEGTGFVATDFSIKFISNLGTESAASFVNVNNTPIWWNYDGIWTMGEGGIQSLTNTTIRQFIEDEVPAVNRKYIQGAYNPLENTIQWLWKSEEPDDIPDSYRYDRILELNVTSGAFYPFKWDIAKQPFSTIFVAQDITAFSTASEPVTDSAVAVTDSAVAVTVSIRTSSSFISSRFKYFATGF